MLDFPTLEEAPAIAPAPRTEVATAAAQALDLAKIDLDAVVREQFGPWRETTAKLKADNAKTVLVLPTQAKVDEAKSLRERTINKPVAEARKTCKALKSMLASASKTAGDEVEALVLAYDEASEPITKQIDAAQARIDAEKAEKARIEREAAERHAARRADIATYGMRAQEPGMTADRIALGIGRLEDADMSDPDNARAVELADMQCRTLESMRVLHAQAIAREAEAARQESIRAENERRAAELAEAERQLAAHAAELRRQAAELEAQRAESARLEALAVANRERLASEEQAKAGAALALAAAMTAAADDVQPIRPDDPDAAPPMTAEEMGAETVDRDDALTQMEDEPPASLVTIITHCAPDVAERVLTSPLKLAADLDAAHALLREALAMADHLAQAFASKYPSQPKMGVEWWAEARQGLEALRPKLLEAVAAKP